MNLTGGIAASEPSPDARMGEQVLDPSSPFDAIRAASGGADVVYVDSHDPVGAVRLVDGADAAVVFAT